MSQKQHLHLSGSTFGLTVNDSRALAGVVMPVDTLASVSQLLLLTGVESLVGAVGGVDGVEGVFFDSAVGSLAAGLERYGGMLSC